MSKKALLFGCGSKWGLSFTKHLSDQGYEIDLVTSTDVNYKNVNIYKIDWLTSSEQIIKDLIKQQPYDLIFFNQNSGGGPGEKDFSSERNFPISHWNLHLWINCQLPYVVIKHLSPSIKETTKIGWMLTGLIAGNDTNLYQYAGYASLKSTNLHIMRGFSQYHTGIFFAINPVWFPQESHSEDSKLILNTIDNLSKIDSGKSFMKTGEVWL
jgi:hypothetical protein